MAEFKRHLITAALPYANGPVHIGHLAGCYIPADIYVRHLKAKGEDALFVCGSDEHGVAITIKAKKEGITPQEVVDRYHGMISQSFKDFGIEFDIYSRTTSPTHKETAQEFFKNFYDKGIFDEKETEQYYDEEANQFLADRYITGTCPNCSFDKAYGDQCENCGKSLSPTDLINPTSTLSGDKPVLRKTRNWFLPLDKHQEDIKKFIDSREGWKPNVIGQSKSWLNEGLAPRAMTRDLDWGVPVPVDGADGKVLYVWFDAPIGYISATKEYFAAKGTPDEWKKYWQDEESRLVHFIGKDNIVFHCIIFPDMLIQHGDYVVPDNVPANEFLNLEGQKLSTSRNWAIWLHEYLEEFPNKQDELRYVLTSIAPETKDSDFTWKDYQARVNNELVAILGNFVNRAVVLTHKFYDGKVPDINRSPQTSSDKLILGEVHKSCVEVGKLLDQFKFREAQAEAMNIARIGNKFLQENEPWKLIKTDKDRTALILNLALEIAANLANRIKPFLPMTSRKIEDMLGYSSEPKTDMIPFNFFNLSGNQLQEAQLLFTKIEDADIDKQIAKLEATKMEQAANEPKVTPQKEEITYDDFVKLDMRVGTITAAEKVEKADKLLKLTVDTGLDVRTVVSGIAEHYKPEDIVGKQVSILVNLAPRKLRGIESQGMILMAEDADGKLVFVNPDDATGNGSVIA